MRSKIYYQFVQGLHHEGKIQPSRGDYPTVTLVMGTAALPWHRGNGLLVFFQRAQGWEKACADKSRALFSFRNCRSPEATIKCKNCLADNAQMRHLTPGAAFQ